MDKTEKEFVEMEEFLRFKDLATKSYHFVRSLIERDQRNIERIERELAGLQSYLDVLGLRDKSLEESIKALWVEMRKLHTSVKLIEVLPGLYDVGRHGLNASIKVGENVTAFAASPLGAGAMGHRAEPQIDFDIWRQVKTVLADIGILLKSLWCIGPGRLWSRLFKVSALAGENIDKRVAAADKPLPDAKTQGFNKFEGRADCGQAHKGSPSVGKGDVGISDSTLRGNLGGEA